MGQLETGEPPLRVLSVDDHPANRTVVEMILELTSAEVTSVEDGAQALEAFKRQDFDIVLMDLQMPVMDGVTATGEIRKYEAARGLARTPILVVTANGAGPHLAAARAAGADDCLAKPVTPTGLIDAVAGTLARAPGGDHRAAASR